MKKMRKAILAALRGDPDMIQESLRERIDSDGPMSTVVQAAEALEPILAQAVRKRPSRLGKLGLKSAHLLASLTEEDEKSNRRLVKIAAGGTVGIVFVDIAGFTNFTVTNGDGVAVEVLNVLGDLVEKSARRCEGEVVKSLGDGYLLAFPSASQAVRGAAGLAESSKSAASNGTSFPVNLRIAVHAGEPLVEGDDLLGHDVNLTARLLDHCRPGEVLVSKEAKELAEKRLRAIEFKNGREVKVRGLVSRVTVFSVASRPAPAPARTTPRTTSKRKVSGRKAGKR